MQINLSLLLLTKRNNDNKSTDLNYSLLKTFIKNSNIVFGKLEKVNSQNNEFQQTKIIIVNTIIVILKQDSIRFISRMRQFSPTSVCGIGTNFVSKHWELHCRVKRNGSNKDSFPDEIKTKKDLPTKARKTLLS